MMVGDDGFLSLLTFHPLFLIPAEPRIALLIEHVQRFAAYLRKLSAPSRPPLDGIVRQDLSDHENSLGAVNLIPDALQDLFESSRPVSPDTIRLRLIFSVYRLVSRRYHIISTMYPLAPAPTEPALKIYPIYIIIIEDTTSIIAV